MNVGDDELLGKMDVVRPSATPPDKSTLAGKLEAKASGLVKKTRSHRWAFNSLNVNGGVTRVNPPLSFFISVGKCTWLGKVKAARQSTSDHLTAAQIVFLMV